MITANQQKAAVLGATILISEVPSLAAINKWIIGFKMKLIVGIDLLISRKKHEFV